MSATERRVIITFIPALLLTAALVGQDAATPAVPELMKLKLDVAALKAQLSQATGELALCRAQLAPVAYRNDIAALDASVKALVDEFEKTNPGWTLTATGHVQPKPKE